MATGLQGAGLVLWLAALAACRPVRPASSLVDFQKKFTSFFTKDFFFFFFFRFLVKFRNL